MFISRTITDKDQDRVCRLLDKIDRGEKGIYLNREKDENFKRFIKRNIFQSPDNHGVFISSIYGNRIRMNISFEKDVTDSTVIDSLIYYIRDTKKTQENLESVYWINGTNINIIQSIKNAFDYKNNPWEGYEFTLYKDKWAGALERSEINIKGYENENIDQYIELLEDSFVGIAYPGEFRDDKINLEKLFREKGEKGEFETLWKEDNLIGLYYLKGNEMDIMAINPQYQRSGYGSIILNRAIENIFTKDSYDHVYLYCVAQNKKASSFYLKNGMEITGHAVYMR